MKILMCHKFHYPLGGSERYVFSLKKGLSQAGHTVMDFSTNDPRNSASEYSGYFINAPDFSRNMVSAINFVYSAQAARSIERLIHDHRPDVAHVHNIYHHITSSILPVLRRKKIPVVATLHDYKLICPNYSLFTKGAQCERCVKGDYLNAVTRKCLKNSYAASALACIEMYFNKAFKMYDNNVGMFIAPSVYMKNKMAGSGMDEKRIRCLPYSIDLSGFTPVPGAGSYILYFGAVSVKKGLLTLIKSLSLFKDIPVKIAGGGPELGVIKEAAAGTGLKNIEFLGPKRKDELIPLIQGCIFAVVPSQWPEVTGLNIYESFACGKCVIASDTGGIPEIVDNGRTGLLFKPSDPQGLAQMMDYLTRNPQKAREMGSAAYEKIRKVNDLGRHCDELAAIYEKAKA